MNKKNNSLYPQKQAKVDIKLLIAMCILFAVIFAFIGIFTKHYSMNGVGLA